MTRRAVRGMRVAALAAVCALVIGACGAFLPGQRKGPFDGDWLLVQAGWGEARFHVAGAGITLVSDGETASGFSGCRDYAYRLNGNADRFHVGEPLDRGPSGERTDALATCRGSLERIESRFLNVLLAADRAEVRGDGLLVSAGNSHLYFRAFPPFPGRELLRTAWVLDGYGDTWQDRWSTDVVGSPTLRFLGRDRFLGTLGCGRIVGTYRVVRTEVMVTSLHRHRAEGCRSAFSDQDQMLAQLLDGFRIILVGEEHLVLMHERLQVMYRAVPASGGPASTAGGPAGSTGFASVANQRS